jgi:hypothetical protein
VINPLRKLSLDKTPPADFEPTGTLRWDATLTDMADYFGSDKGSIKHNYTDRYDRLLCGWRQEPMTLLEIGVACGASLKMWSRYFPYGKITGVDIRPECASLCQGYPNVEIVIADATKEAVPGMFDVVVDDGSHIAGHIVKAFKLHWPKVKTGGVYCIEDLRCTHNPNYTVPFPVDQADKDRAPFMAMLDALMRNCDMGGEVESVQCWRELIAIKKRAA